MWQNLKNKNKTLPAVPIVKVSNGPLDTDPENPPNRHFCNPEATATIEAYQVHREVLVEVQRASKRPKEAYGVELAKVNFYANLFDLFL